MGCWYHCCIICFPLQRVLTMSIHAAFIINNLGNPRLVRIYDADLRSHHTEAQLVSLVHLQIEARAQKGGQKLCNFLEGVVQERQELVCVCNTFATLHFAVLVDRDASFLDMLDLIGNVVGTLDLLFPSVCELDLVFNYPLVNSVFDEWIVGGLIVDTTPRAAAEDVRQLEATSNAGEEYRISKAAAAIVHEIKEKLTPERGFKKI